MTEESSYKFGDIITSQVANKSEYFERQNTFLSSADFNFSTLPLEITCYQFKIISSGHSKPTPVFCHVPQLPVQAGSAQDFCRKPHPDLSQPKPPSRENFCGASVWCLAGCVLLQLRVPAQSSHHLPLQDPCLGNEVSGNRGWLYRQHTDFIESHFPLPWTFCILQKQTWVMPALTTPDLSLPARQGQL